MSDEIEQYHAAIAQLRRTSTEYLAELIDQHLPMLKLRSNAMTTRPYVPRQPAPTTATIPIMRFDPRASGLERWLGPLEAACMDYLYSADGPRTVKHVWHGMRQSDNAYTTIMTTMTRLSRKGLLSRRRAGMAYVYVTTCSRDEFVELQIAAVLRGVEA